MPSDTIRRSRRVQVQDAQDVFSYQQVAQSPQQAAASATGGGLAGTLSKAMEMGGKFAANRVNKHNEFQSRKAETDFASGNVDEANRNQHYGERIMRLETQRALADDEQELNQILSDRDPQSREEFDQILDEHFGANYTGLEEHPQAADYAIKRMEQLREGLWNERAAAQQKEDLDRQSSNLNLDVQEKLASGEEFDYADLDASAVAIEKSLGLPPGSAWDIQANVLMENAEALGRPDLIDNAPENLTNIGRLKGAFADSRVRAEKKRLSIEEVEKGEARMIVHAEDKVNASQGTLSLERVAGSVKDGVYSREQGASLLAQNATAQIKADSTYLNVQAIRQGYGFSVDPSEYQDGLTAAAEQQAGETGRSVDQEMFNLGLQNGTFADKHKRLITMAPLGNAELFEKSHGLYMNYYGADKGKTIQNISSDVQRTHEQYETLTTQMGLSDEDARKLMMEADFDEAGKQMNGRDYHEALAATMDEIKDLPWSFTELEASPVLYRDVRTQVQAHMAAGIPMERAMELAVANAGRNRVEIDGYAFSHSQGIPAEDTDEWVEHVKMKFIPEGEDPDDYEMTPNFHTRATNDVTLIRKGDLPFGAGHISFDIREQATLWEASRRVDAAEQVTEDRKVHDQGVREAVIRQHIRAGKGQPSEEEIAAAVANRKEMPQRIKRIFDLTLQSFTDAIDILPDLPEGENRNPRGR